MNDMILYVSTNGEDVSQSEISKACQVHIAFVMGCYLLNGKTPEPPKINENICVASIMNPQFRPVSGCAVRVTVKKV